ncbi:GH36-type glycosyl hydrolase domain-containing protein [Rossellomorea vietnamensis]|uniref:GH36-type glycosyl hydrolase domain-containing protein n=1 Tax=Rossellomorea vietnamensis TaxID=218284 RepID=UPI003CF4230D
MTINTHINLQLGDLQASFLPSGDIYKIANGETMINQVLSNPVDGSLNNIYLRIHEESEIKAIPLLGVHSRSTVSVSTYEIKWAGQADSIEYEVRFSLTPRGIWFWDIQLEGTNADVDVIYGQDISIANMGAVRSNEAYTSQYIDHSVFKSPVRGYVVCSRQNQPQDGLFPYLQQGSLGKTVGYSTDGYQFFGLSYKTTNTPEILSSTHLKNEVYQYEFAYTALQSEKVTLDGKHQFTFYGLFKEDHPHAISESEYEDEVLEAWQSVQSNAPVYSDPINRVVLSDKVGSPLQTIEMDTDEINRFFPDRILEEQAEGSLLSFFTPTYEHVVLKQKEQLVERPHGHILMNGNNDYIRDDVFTTSVYMYGMFNSQIAVGNISMNKMITNSRNPLNILKTSGQRIYVEMDGRYCLMTMPSLFEMGMNYAKWYYKTADELFIITTFTTVDKKDVQLEFEAQSGKSYRYLVTHQVTMNNNEYEAPFAYNIEGNQVTFKADSLSDSSDTLPELGYRLQLNEADVQFGDERLIAHNVEPMSASLLVGLIDSASKWTLSIQGDLYGDLPDFDERNFTIETHKYREYYKQVMRGFHLSNAGETSEELEKVNALAYWYTHNMLVHFSTPHGLEQYGGAAWGTRDVNQGPVEYFMATQNYSTVREIITSVFAHQYEDSGDWPQWFMFDQYTKIQQTDSHGDIIVWPLKVVGDYIEATEDYEILKEQIAYMDKSSFTFTENKESLLSHIKKEIAYMKEHFLHDTFLPSYDDGDWDDTLQPANQQLKKYMVSTWTVALMYQSLRKFASILAKVDKEEASRVDELVEGIRQDFYSYILTSDVIPGFVYMEKPDEAEFMLHPTDSKTGIHYRLLPMQRSIISELFTPEQADRHYKLIREHLYCPDGVRLMNQPANYTGGVSTHFKRAEQASNFGREIGLQYVHAHIRFVEAMAKLGIKEEVWQGLRVINPIKIQEAVPNAEIRQSNAYFSSSDGKFNTRYEAQEHFHKLKDGSVPVKGGWRIYSSGPGIYMNQLISNALGIRQFEGNLILDAILPESMDGTEFTYSFQDKPISLIYHLQTDERYVKINGKRVETTNTDNSYRKGGLMISKEILKDLLKNDRNVIELFI